MHGEWSPDRAEELARCAGVGMLGGRHWKVIASTREETARLGHAPRLRRIEELTGLAAGELNSLFPGDVEALIIRIAGCDRPPIDGRERTARDSGED